LFALCALGVALASAGALVAGWRYLGFGPRPQPMVDLEVYKRAGRDLWGGRPLYSDATDRLVFTYPPFAALVGLLTAPFGRATGNLVWTVLQTALLALIVRLSFRSVLERLGRGLAAVTVGAIVGLALLTHPLIENVFFGQVNVLVAALVMIDLVGRRGGRREGVATGIAAAIKLTPLIFVAHLVACRRLDAARRALVTFLVASAFAAALAPASSWRYWTHQIMMTRRIGNLAYTSTQSILGALDRVLPDGLVRPVWLGLSIVVVGLGLRRAAAADRAGDVVGGVALAATVGLLVSPVSWIHHYLWVVVMTGAIVGTGRDRRRLLAAVVFGGLFLLRLPWWGKALVARPWPLHGLGLILHNGYTVLALVVLFAYPVVPVATRLKRRPLQKRMVRPT